MVESKPSKKWEKVFCLSLEIGTPPSESARHLQHEKIVDLDTDDPKLQFLTYHCFFYMFVTIKTNGIKCMFHHFDLSPNVSFVCETMPCCGKEDTFCLRIAEFCSACARGTWTFPIFWACHWFFKRSVSVWWCWKTLIIDVFFSVFPFEIPVTTTHP